MEKSEFEKHRLEWIKEWHSTYRLLDIDFDVYMIMNGMTPDEFKRLNEMDDESNTMDFK